MNIVLFFFLGGVPYIYIYIYILYGNGEKGHLLSAWCSAHVSTETRTEHLVEVDGTPNTPRFRHGFIRSTSLNRRHALESSMVEVEGRVAPLKILDDQFCFPKTKQMVVFHVHDDSRSNHPP